jgi:hypothetical protein
MAWASPSGRLVMTAAAAGWAAHSRAAEKAQVEKVAQIAAIGDFMEVSFGGFGPLP